MSRSTVIFRESLISIVVSACISVGFFFVIFGLGRSIPLEIFGPDFFPQSFMIALMGALVPSLLLRRKLGGDIRIIFFRSIVTAIAAGLVFGGLGYIICRNWPGHVIEPVDALLIKTVYGGFLAALITPYALKSLYSQATRND